MTDLFATGLAACAALTRAHGTTYYWGARLLRPTQRHDVYAVYALCRLADDIVDEPDRPSPYVGVGGPPAERLTAFRQQFEEVTFGGAATTDPVLTVVADTIRRRGIPADCFVRFFDAMALDLTTTTWPSWPALRDGYMEGSAAVIGEMMLPVLEPTSPAAHEPARSLGLAFQLTNFIRDVSEDLDRGRVYLPADELTAHGADPRLRRVTPQWQRFLAGQIERNRALYRHAEQGLPHLPPSSRRCVATALTLYEQILDRIERAEGDVFTRRIRVPTPLKLATAVASFVPRPEGKR
ncbi:MAG: phytoene/squalene synthase family protein [Propionibacteriaceae bacterium]|nr:phytoene/squalene synthase family protein [Propionibacteriaceae bacterium]